MPDGIYTDTDAAESHIDPGVPYEHSREPERETPKDDKPAAKAGSDSEERELREARAAAEFWKSQARDNHAPRGRQPEPEAEEDEPETPTVQLVTAAADMSTDQLLDNFSTKGIKALVDQGVITADKLIEVLEASQRRNDARTDAKIAEFAENQAADNQISSEFPELAKDDNAITAWVKNGERGARPEVSETYKAASRIFKEMISDSGVKPDSKAGRGMLIAAARAARREVGQVEPRSSRGEDRRSRIDAQRGDRGRAYQEDTGGGKGMDRQTQAVFGHLSRFGVTASDYQKYSPAGKGVVKHDR